MKYLYSLIIIFLIGVIYILLPKHIMDGTGFPSGCYQSHILFYCSDSGDINNLSFKKNIFFIKNSNNLLRNGKHIINRQNSSKDTILSDWKSVSYLNDTYLLTDNFDTNTLYVSQSGSYSPLLTGNIDISTRIPTIGRNKQGTFYRDEGYNYIYDNISQKLFLPVYSHTQPLQVQKSVYQLETAQSSYFIIDDVLTYNGIIVESGSLIEDYTTLGYVWNEDTKQRGGYISDGRYLRYGNVFLGETGPEIVTAVLFNESTAEDDNTYYINDQRFEKTDISSMEEAIKLFKQN